MLAPERCATIPRMDPPPVKLVLADDHALVRAGLRRLLEEQGWEVVAEAGTTDEARRYVAGHRPDVLILDLNMPGETNSLKLIAPLREAHPETAIVVVTMNDELAFVRVAMRAGAAAYVIKTAATEELVGAVRAAAAGERYLSPKLGAEVASADAREAAPDGLTARELEVLGLLAIGHTNQEIARHLVLSARTVESHRTHIQEKTGCTTRAAMVRYAVHHGLVDLAQV